MSVIISDFLTDNNFEDAVNYLVGKKRDVFCIIRPSNPSGYIKLISVPPY